MRSWLVALLLAPAVAWANGRPPLTNGVVFRPGDNQSIYIRSTFGLLISHDDGCSFRWVCEKAIGYGGEFDPKYAIASDGTVFATTFTGLRVSRDGGCTWTTATAEKPAGDPGRIADIWIDALDIAPTGEIWVATAESAGANNVFHSTDNGVTFAPGGLPSSTIWWKSIKVAKSNAQRIYASGYQVAPTAQAHLFRSDNNGAQWAEQPLAATIKVASTPIVLVSAINPTNPDDLFLTSLGGSPPNGDVLYRSTNGGVSFTEVLTTIDPVRDVVFRTNGTVLVATLAGGTFQAQGTGAFIKLGAATPNTPDVKPPNHGCLGESPDGELIGCGANWQPDYMAVGRATDPLAFQKVFRFVELAGTLECPAGTSTQDWCAPAWPALAQQFGVTGPSATCGAVTDHSPIDGPNKPKPPSTGCCDAGDGAPVSLVFSAPIALLLLRRRRS